jgi:hypothetical protein
VSALEQALRRVASDLSSAGRAWALVEGLAVSARAEPRRTRDVDAVAAVPDDRDAERLVHDLGAAGYQRAATTAVGTSRRSSRPRWKR